jgi:hypothetical protein
MARRARFGPKHMLGLFAFYAILTFCVLAFTFFYVFTVGDMALVAILTVAVGVVATAVHVRAGKRTRVDALVDRGR